MNIRNINKRLLISISTFSLIVVGIGSIAIMSNNGVNAEVDGGTDISSSIENSNIEKNNYNNDGEYHSFYDGKFGSCGKLEGNTVIVSIIADDEFNKWEYGTDFIEYGENEILNDLNSSTAFMIQKAEEYGKNVTFIYDWTNNEDLLYNANFNCEIFDDHNEYTDYSAYYIEKQWIMDNIDIDNIKNKYKADNIAFIFYFNPGRNNICRPCAFTHFSSDDIDVELINMYTRWNQYSIPVPFTYVHEMFHLYGAPDLYHSNEFIPEEYVEYCDKIQKNDIMYNGLPTRDIPECVTELDAYYIGLTDSSSEKELWNLGQSEQSTKMK